MLGLVSDTSSDIFWLCKCEFNNDADVMHCCLSDCKHVRTRWLFFPDIKPHK